MHRVRAGFTMSAMCCGGYMTYHSYSPGPPCMVCRKGPLAAVHFARDLGTKPVKESHKVWDMTNTIAVTKRSEPW